jgi:hypothetical protein
MRMLLPGALRPCRSYGSAPIARRRASRQPA